MALENWRRENAAEAAVLAAWHGTTSAGAQVTFDQPVTAAGFLAAINGTSHQNARACPREVYPAATRPLCRPPTTIRSYWFFMP
jgi:hypothetical protein